MKQPDFLAKISLGTSINLLWLFLLLTMGCDHVNRSDAEEVAAAAGLNYPKLVALAEEGNTQALKTLMDFSKLTDGGSAYDHAITLFRVCMKCGDKVTSDLIPMLDQDAKARVSELLEGGFKESQLTKKATFEETLPQTSKLLKQ